MQGFNMGRYRPPEALDSALSVDGKAGSLQKRNPALGNRGRKSNLGITTVRFEMPFAIWCSNCPSNSSSQLIGQGVRFNAEKKKVGNYFSTPIWSFRMKHAACGGWLEIRTDPKNSEYEVVDGARRRDTGDDAAVAERTGAVVVGADEKAREDAFTALEGKKEDKVRAKTEAARLEELKSLRSRDWKDPDVVNKKLRREFRAGRKVRQQEAQGTADLQDKMSLGVDLLPESASDRQRAQLVEFGDAVGEDDQNADVTAKLARKALFSATLSASSAKRSQSKLLSLQSELASNTRAKADPFSQGREVSFATRSKISGIKRKLVDTKTIDAVPTYQHSKGNDRESINEEMQERTKPAKESLLVDYDSD